MSLSSEPDTSRPSSRLKVIDLFSGVGGWSRAFKDRGHDVLTLDNYKHFKTDIVKNILDVTPSDFPWKPDIVLASPPCETFSLLTAYMNWTGLKDKNPHMPKTIKAKLALKVLNKTIELIDQLSPRYFIIENPMAKMRHMQCMSRYERRSVTYCQYGMPYRKPTDLFGVFPPTLKLKPPCKLRSPCHEGVKPGDRRGIKAVTTVAARSEVPYQLALEVCEATERGGTPTEVRQLFL